MPTLLRFENDAVKPEKPERKKSLEGLSIGRFELVLLNSNNQ
jgi:hypothetical protein